MIVSQINLEDVLLHGGIASSSRSWGSVVGAGISIVGVVEVVGHLRVKLFSSLLGWASAAALARCLLGTGLASSSTALGPVRTVLHGSSRLGLSLGRSNTLGEGLGLRDEFGGRDDNLNLWSSLVILIML